MCGYGQSWTSTVLLQLGVKVSDGLRSCSGKGRQWDGQTEGLLEPCFLKKSHEAFQRSQGVLRWAVSAEHGLRSHLTSLFVEGNNYTVVKVFTC